MPDSYDVAKSLKRLAISSWENKDCEEDVEDQKHIEMGEEKNKGH